MSLDVYLTLKGLEPDQPSISDGIFVRELEQTKEISRAEWDRRFPGREPITYTAPKPHEEVYSANITHNLSDMASEAGLYAALWRPDEHAFKTARQLIGPLKVGLAILRAEPERFKALNPSNGWGDYDGLCQFVADYLAACEQHPNATVLVSR